MCDLNSRECRRFDIGTMNEILPFSAFEREHQMTIRGSNLESGTTIFALRGRDSIVVGADGRRCEGLFGSPIAGNAIKFHCLYGNVFAACAGNVGFGRNVMEAVRYRCNTLKKPTDVKAVASMVKRRADRELLKDDSLKCRFIVFGALDNVSPLWMYKVDVCVDPQHRNRKVYDVERGDELVIGSGEEHVRSYRDANINELRDIIRNGSRSRVRDFVRRAIYNARLNDFATDGDIRAVSVCEAGTGLPTRVLYETSRLVDQRFYGPVRRLGEAYHGWVRHDFEPHGVP